LAKIALIARGDGWRVRDVVCTSGPHDRPYEEQHSDFSIAIVLAGSFEYRSALGSAVMTPGSLLFGNAGQLFECGHEHGCGDRCLAFNYEPESFERIVDAKPAFGAVRVPPLRALSPIIARACAGLAGSAPVSWEEISLQIAVRALDASNGERIRRSVPRNAIERITRIVRAIERHSDREIDLSMLARDAGLSPFHFLRTFQRVTGVTPHQYLLRTRLRNAAARLAGRAKIVDVALDSGFGDVSNFNRTFRAEFGTTPRAYRRALLS
jgi:AraC family transcriptional regulator